MNILHIINSLHIGGAERLLIDFINHYKQCYPDDKHFLLCLKDGNKDLIKEVEPSLDSYSSFGLTSSNRFYTKRSALKQLVKNYNIDVIHSHLTYSIVLSRMIRLKEIVRFATYHNMEYSKESPNYSNVMPRLDQFFYNSSNSFSIYVSKEVEKAVRGRIKRMTHGLVIPNFAAERFSYRYSFQSEGLLKLVAVGGLKKVKNHSFLLDALRIYADSNIHLDIYGEGGYREELQKIIDKENLPVSLKGSHYITSDLLCQYDAFILPSFSEGMPISLIEAMSSGMPCLLSNLPQLKDVAGDSALYFDPYKVQELVDIFENLSTNKSELVLMSKRAKILSQGLSIDHYVHQLNELYHQQLLRIRES